MSQQLERICNQVACEFLLFIFVNIKKENINTAHEVWEISSEINTSGTVVFKIFIPVLGRGWISSV